VYKSSIFLLALIAGAAVCAQSLRPDAGGSSVRFSIKNFGATVTGHFSGLKGTMVYDGSNPEKISFNMEVDAGSIATGNKARDSHLRKEEYFNAGAFPSIHFVSGKVTKTKTGEFTVSGRLTIKGVTKEINFPFTATPKGGGILFEGTFTLNRRDYSVGGGSFVMGDNVTVMLSVLGVR
jgi:polyisoprenoid-binding protein YceI